SSPYGDCPCSQQGMPDWSVNEPFLDLRLHDTPLAYQSSVSEVSFEIDYWQRDFNVPSTSVFNMGPGWECSWLAYVQLVDSSNRVFTPHGGSFQITDTTGTTPNYYYNLLTKEIADSHGNFTNCTVSYPSGAKDVYDFSVTDSYGSVSQLYLSHQFNPQG